MVPRFVQNSFARPLASPANRGPLQRYCTVIALVTMAASVSTAAAQDWQRHLSFEKGVVGKAAVGPSAFQKHEAFEQTRVSAAQAYAGRQSAQISIGKGQSGYGVWGALLSFPHAVHENESVWLLAHFYLPAEFDTTAKDPGLQLFRIDVLSAERKTEGAIVVTIDSKTRRLNVINSVVDDGEAKQPARAYGKPFSLGQWQAVELQVTFAAQRGRGIVRVWQDTELVFEDAVTPTLRTPFSHASHAYVFGYWRGGAPKSQSAYLDEVIVTNRPPAQRDRLGHARLWPATAQEKPAPNPIP